jgi:hypothetical protein
MFKILSTYICLKKYIKCNIWRVAVRPSHIEDARFLKVKKRKTAREYKRYRTSGWFYSRNTYITMHSPTNVKFGRSEFWTV